jgi:hypothetical protein
MTKRNIRRLLLLPAVVVVMLGIAILLLISTGPAPPSPPLPNPNGYDDLLKAGQALVGKLFDADQFDHNGLRALVATNAEALRILRVGLSRSCAGPTDATNTVAGMRSLALLLAAEGRLAELENRTADAARSYLDAIHLGSEVSRGGSIINRMVGIACEAIGCLPLVKLLPSLTCEQMRPILTELKRIDENIVRWPEVLENENRFARAAMRKQPNPVPWVLEFWQVRNIRKAAATEHDLAAARLRLLFTELALRAYKCDHGSGPTDLANLVPNYLRRLPTDPFSSHPFIYRQAGTNWILYSVGPDRVDDGGKPMVKMGQGYLSPAANYKGDLMYDSAW